jgi:hypothetical protein
MLDVWQGRVLYVHSGSEEPWDVLVFSVFSSSVRLQELAEVSRGKGRVLHRLPVAVRPVNDAPQLSLPAGNLLTLLERSRRQVGAPELYKEGCSVIVFKVLAYLVCNLVSTSSYALIAVKSNTCIKLFYAYVCSAIHK